MADEKIKPNREGKVVEFKKGHYYMTHTEWEDGHHEIEVHRCVPELIWHSCDINQLDEAKRLFSQLEHKHPTQYKLKN